VAEGNRGPGFWAGLIVGGLVGAVIGLLMAPQKGEETLRQLRERGVELRSRADELAARARELAQEAVEEGKKAAEQAGAELKKRFEEAKVEKAQE